jgi:hypothetical protein
VVGQSGVGEVVSGTVGGESWGFFTKRRAFEW